MEHAGLKTFPTGQNYGHGKNMNKPCVEVRKISQVWRQQGINDVFKPVGGAKALNQYTPKSS